MDNIALRAQTAVGSENPEADWRLAPSTHAANLSPEAGALRRVLERPEIRDLMTTFQTSDTEAGAAQSRYKSVGRLALRAILAATLVGAIFILPLELWKKPMALGIATALQFLLLALGYGCSLYLAHSKVFDQWMKARAKAELARIALFDQVMAAEEASRSGELPLLPLQLEYVRRYQLDVQRLYYTGQGERQRRAAGYAAGWITASYILTGVSIGVAALAALLAFEIVGLPEWILKIAKTLNAFGEGSVNVLPLAVGVVASAFYGLAASLSLLNMDARNASRYLTTADNLAFLSEQSLEAARRAAAAGDKLKVLDFTGRIQALVSSEHREWALLRDVTPRFDPRDMPTQSAVSPRVLTNS